MCVHTYIHMEVTKQQLCMKHLSSGLYYRLFEVAMDTSHFACTVNHE